MGILPTPSERAIIFYYLCSMRKNKTKTSGTVTRGVDGKENAAIETVKVIKRSNGLVKKTVVKGVGIGDSVLGRYKEVKRYKDIPNGEVMKDSSHKKKK